MPLVERQDVCRGVPIREDHDRRIGQAEIEIAGWHVK